MKQITLTGHLETRDWGEGPHKTLYCGDIIVAEWAIDNIGDGDSLEAHIWDTRYLPKEEADRLTREYPHNKWVSVRYWIADKQESIEAIKQRAIEQLYGAVKADWGSRYSEITGYLWTDEDFQVGGHDMIGRLTSEIGKYLVLEIDMHEKPLPDGAAAT